MSAANRRRWWIPAVLCLSVLFVVVDNTIVIYIEMDRRLDPPNL